MAYSTINAELNDAHRRGRQHDRKPQIIPVHAPPPKARTPIPRNVRRTLVNRITRQNRQEFNPAIEALKRQKQKLLPQYQREVASAQGYVDLASEAVQDISLKGLHGRYKGQVASELANRAADIEQSAPILAQEARQEYQAAKSDIQQDIVGARLDKQAAISKETASALDQARTDLHSAALRKETRLRARNKARRSAATGGAEERQESAHDLQLALHEAERWITQFPKYIPKNVHQWAMFEDEIGKAEGVTPEAAADATRIFRARYGY